MAEFEALAKGVVGRSPVAVSSGSAALELSLQAIGVAGRTVLIPVNTFFATASAAIRSGASVDFVDLAEDGFGMDPADLGRRMDAHTGIAAVVLVHLAGVVSPTVREIREMCRARSVPIVEDAAHALGSQLDGRQAGTFGDFAAFSLYPTKVVTSGEGGLVTFGDEDARRTALRIRDHGRTAAGSVLHDVLGTNWRMSEVQAAVGTASLSTFDATLEVKSRLAAAYDRALPAIPGARSAALPVGSTSNWYKYIAVLDEDIDRSVVKCELLKGHGVRLAGEVYGTILSDQPYFRGNKRDFFPRAKIFSRRHICLPLHPSMTPTQQERVIDALADVLGRLS